jgi:peptidoglycan-associated lipoprotein
MMKYTTLPLALLLAASAAIAQPINRPSPDKLLLAAQEAEANNNPYRALGYYQDVLDETKDNTIIPKLAELNFQLRDYEKAERLLKRVVLRDRKQAFTEYKYLYAMCLKHNGRYDEAVDMFRQYLSDGASDSLKTLAQLELDGCQMARKANAPENLSVTNIGKAANSPQTEASPNFVNGELYYTSLQGKEVITLDGKEGDWFSKVYVTSKTGDNTFGSPMPLDNKINREGYHQGNVSITPDGRTMYFTRVSMESQEMNESKIYYAIRGTEGWGAAKEVLGVNGNYIAKHPCEGELFGEKVLFFVADIPGGEGDDDIYYAPKKDDGLFGSPVPLGKGINTPGKEASPFYQDGKLFFSTNGRPGFGGLDVFSSQWNGAVWSAPENLGPGINSSVDDQFYAQEPDGFSGFVVSNRPGINNLKSKTCCDDIYYWEKERIKLNLTAETYRLRRKGEKTNPPLEGCTVRLEDISELSPIRMESRTNEKANLFAFTLAPEKSYLLIAEKEGYKPDTAKVSTVGLTRTTTKTEKLTLRLDRKKDETILVKTNEPIRLNNIYYDFDDDKVLPDAEKDLRYLVELMNQYPDMVIELSSHTDSRGRDDYNEALSQRRAESAKRFMVAQGVTASRIVAKGYGEKQILNGCANGVNCDEEQHRFNRRTEFKIISGPTSIEIEKVVPNVPPGQNPGGKQSKPAFMEFLKAVFADTIQPDSDPAVADLVMQFEGTDKTFGPVKEGEQVFATYAFKNTAPVPISIMIVSACDCMKVNWTRGEIQSGQSGKVEVMLDTTKRPGRLAKDIDVILDQEGPDGYPILKRLTLIGQVTK